MSQLHALGPASSPRGEHDGRDGTGVVLHHLVRRWLCGRQPQKKRLDFRVWHLHRTENMLDARHPATLIRNSLPLAVPANEQGTHVAALGYIGDIAPAVPVVQRHGDNPEARRGQVQGDPIRSPVRHDADSVARPKAQPLEQRLGATDLCMNGLPTVAEPFAQHVAVFDVSRRVRRGRNPLFEQLPQSVVG